MDSARVSVDNARGDRGSNPAIGPHADQYESGKFKERSDMTTKSKLYLGAVVIAVALAGSVSGLAAQQAPAVALDNDDIGGVVTGANGPEAGVWVIAETNDLPTRYAKMVVTD